MSDLYAPQAARRAVRSRRSRRRSIAGLAAFAAVLLAVVPLATACGAGFTADSQTIRPNTGAGTSGDLKVNNVWVVVDTGSGLAQVIGAVANTGSTVDQVVGVTAGGLPARAAGPAATGTAPPGAASTGTGATGAAANGVIVCPRAAIVGGAVVVRPNQSVNFGQPGCPRLLLTAGPLLRPGRITPVTLTFARAAPLSFNAQIVSATGLFAEYKVPRVVVIVPVAVSNRSSASPGASTSASRTASPSGNPSASASASASGSANPSTTAGASASATPSGTA